MQKFRNLINDRIVVSKTGKIFQIWQVFITLSKISSSFYYLQLCTHLHGSISRTELGDLFYLSTFCIDMGLNCITEREICGPETSVITRDIVRIIQLYLFDGFLMDLVTLLPFFQLLIGICPYAKYFYFIKVYKIKSGIETLNASVLVSNLRRWSQSRVEAIIQKDH